MPDVEVESGGPVWDLVADFLERRERGEAVSIEEFIRSHPQVADRLRECLAGFQWMEATVRPEQVAPDEDLPRPFGNYELSRVIGRGGMGCVYEAMHRPLGRRVAVKVLPPHLTLVREFRLRFLREARVVASLHHTHIAPVFEVGQIGGALYLAMPFINGPNLRELMLPSSAEEAAAQKAARDRLPLPFTRSYFRWVASVGLQSAEALAHAHGRGVIHRDVKPSNLLLDEHGTIWMVDFGLAKAPRHPALTVPGELIGTLRYASPEQVRGESLDVRTDVYSLGVTLYELLTRRPAFPPGPGTQPFASEPMRPRLVNSRIPRDLETIVLRAMAKRPADRYATAAALADDLRHFLRDEPIRARPIGPIGRFVRWCRRNPALSAVTSGALILLGTLAAFDHIQLIRQRDALANSKAVADERLAELLGEKAARAIESDQPGRMKEALELVAEAAKIRFRPELWDLAMRAIDRMDTAGPRELNDTSGWLEILARDTSDTKLHQSVGAVPHPITSLAGSRDNRWIAWADETGHVSLVDLLERRTRLELDSGLQDAQLSFRPDGKQLALVGTGDPPIKVLTVPEGEFTGVGRADNPCVSAAFVGRGDRLAAAHADGTLVIWDLQSAQPFATVLVGPIASLVASSDGKWLVGAGRSGELHLWDPASMRHSQVPHAHHTAIRKVAFSPDDRAVASCGNDGRICVWRVPELTRQLAVEGSGGSVIDLAFCLGGSTLASCSDDGRISLWSLETTHRVGTLGEHIAGHVGLLAATRDGRRLIAVSGSGRTNQPVASGLEIWDLAALRRAVLRVGLPDWCPPPNN